MKTCSMKQRHSIHDCLMNNDHYEDTQDRVYTGRERLTTKDSTGTPAGPQKTNDQATQRVMRDDTGRVGWDLRADDNTVHRICRALHINMMIVVNEIFGQQCTHNHNLRC